MKLRNTATIGGWVAGETASPTLKQQCGFLRAQKNFKKSKLSLRWGLQFQYCLYLIRLERTVNRTHLSGSTFASVAWRPWVLVRTVLELACWGSGYQIELTGQKLNNAAMFWIVLDWFIMTQTMIESKGRRRYFTCQIKSSKFTFSTMLLPYRG